MNTTEPDKGHTHATERFVDEIHGTVSRGASNRFFCNLRDYTLPLIIIPVNPSSATEDKIKFLKKFYQRFWFKNGI